MQSAIQEPSTLPVDPHAEVIRLQACLAESEQQRAAQQQALEENRTLLEERAQRIEQLLDLITVLKRKRFGRSADVISPDQLSLFDEAELEALIGELETEVETTGEAPAEQPPTEKPKGKPVRRPLPEHLPRVDRVIDLSEADKQAMGSDWTFIGYDEAEQLAIIPRQPYIIVVKRAKYAPLDDSLTDAGPGVVIAPRAPQILPKAIADSSLLADVVVGKFVDGLPLYRQEKIWAREGIELARQTMAGWMIQLDAKLAPLMAAMKAVLYQGRVMHIDETRLQVLQEPGREATQQSFMWVYCGGTPDHPTIWFQYAETRSGAVPQQFLFPDPPEVGDAAPPSDGMYLLSDGYCAYTALALQAGIIGHAACWAHYPASCFIWSRWSAAVT